MKFTSDNLHHDLTKDVVWFFGGGGVCVKGGGGWGGIDLTGMNDRTDR